jgi:hypothetical protein
VALACLRSACRAVTIPQMVQSTTTSQDLCEAGILGSRVSINEMVGCAAGGSTVTEWYFVMCRIMVVRGLVLGRSATLAKGIHA